MTKPEYLLACLAEECDEVGQRCMKALRFGLGEVQPGQTQDNRTRLLYEVRDLLTVIAVLEDGGILPPVRDVAAELAKRAKLNQFEEYARKIGALRDAPTVPRVVAYVEGGVVQGARASAPVDFDVYDADDAEGTAGEEEAKFDAQLIEYENLPEAVY